MKPNKNSLTTKNLRSIARGLVFVMLFLALYVVLSMVFTPKVDGEPGGMTNDITYSYRAESKNSVDVVFIGNSDVARGINPAQIYRDTGITSVTVGRPPSILRKCMICFATFKNISRRRLLRLRSIVFTARQTSIIK